MTLKDRWDRFVVHHLLSRSQVFWAAARYYGFYKADKPEYAQKGLEAVRAHAGNAAIDF